MLVYGIAFDFFNISGSLFVNQNTEPHMRSSAQGLFMMMCNGMGATIGTLAAQSVVNTYVFSHTDAMTQLAGWHTAWTIFTCYAVVVGILFALLFRNSHK
jgi:MFS family permease